MFSRILFCIPLLLLTLNRGSASNSPSANNSDSLHWTSEAKLDRLPKAIRGTLVISSEAVDFRPAKGHPVHWALQDIRTVDIAGPRKLSLISYENSRWHVPGDRPFDFKLKNPMPPEVAAGLVDLVGKPAINGLPLPRAASLATIGARHRTRAGGSNGILRFSHNGVDYLASKGADSRSWRWADIQTLAEPAPYRLRIAGYLETFDFELKQPLPDDLYDRLWDHVYAQGLNMGEQKGEAHAEMH
jgi:hypothetical protein